MLIQLLQGNFSPTDLVGVLLAIPCVILALCVHETAHGWVAWKMGDPTAHNLGRLTLNPLRHLDLFGTLCMLVVGYGWAKPVPINTRNFKKPRMGMALSAAAGPLSNLLLGVFGVILYRIVMKIYTVTGILVAHDGILYIVAENYAPYMAVATFLSLFYQLNFSLGLFNLIPIPPFDGSRILFVFLPDKWYFGIMKYERYILIAVLILIYTGILNFSSYGIVSWITNGINRLMDLLPFLSLV